MGTSDLQQTISLDEDPPGNSNRHKILSVPIVAKLLQSFGPHLLEDPEHFRPILDQIDHYLFRQPRLADKDLRDALPEELYTALYGLKVLLKRHNLNVTSFVLEEHKRFFKRFLDRELEDE